jgi:hypothetical protein
MKLSPPTTKTQKPQRYLTLLYRHLGWPQAKMINWDLFYLFHLIRSGYSKDVFLKLLEPIISQKLKCHYSWPSSSALIQFRCLFVHRNCLFSHSFTTYE